MRFVVSTYRPTVCRLDFNPTAPFPRFCAFSLKWRVLLDVTSAWESQNLKKNDLGQELVPPAHLKAHEAISPKIWIESKQIKANENQRRFYGFTSIYINSKYPNSWLENITFYWKLRIFESAVWVLWLDINQNLCLE